MSLQGKTHYHVRLASGRLGPPFLTISHASVWAQFRGIPRAVEEHNGLIRTPPYVYSYMRRVTLPTD